MKNHPDGFGSLPGRDRAPVQGPRRESGLAGGVVLLLIQLLFLPPQAQSEESDSRILMEESLARHRGEQVYQVACAACHGKSGDGKGVAARYLDPLPRDFTSGTYKFRSTADGEIPTDEDLQRTVSQGVPRTMMPGWEDLLTARQIGDVVAYIKTFSAKFEQYGPGTPIVFAAEPEATPETLTEGKNLYILMQCAECHGTAGRGDGKAASTLVDDWKQKIEPFDFTRGSFKAGNDNSDVYKTFITGLNGSPMPAYADAMLFGEITAENLDTYAENYSETEMETLKAFLGTQPTNSELDRMSDQELTDLMNRRNWSLVHYVKSLAREKSLFYRIFSEDLETR